MSVKQSILDVRQTFHLSKLEFFGYWSSKFQKKAPMKDPIDFVVTWVDGNDEKWRKTKSEYQKEDTVKKGNTEARFRDWDQFKYWFRAVEKYAPWVRKVFLITEGHVPSWINKDNPKLVLVKHSDYIDEKYLPVFSSVPIELCMGNIEDLSEHFVYFCDDFYLNARLCPEDFFRGGLPIYCSVAKPLMNGIYNGPFAHQAFGVLGVANGKIDWQDSINRYPEKWFSHVYSHKERKYAKRLYEDAYLTGMYISHLPVPFRKSTLQHCWKEYFNEFDETCKHRFRTPLDLMHHIFTVWEIAHGTYIPVSGEYYGKKFAHLSTQIDEITTAMLTNQYKTICLNDSVDVTEENFEEIRDSLNTVFEQVFPDKSSFEL